MSNIYTVQCCYTIQRCEEFLHNFCEEHCEEIKTVLKRYPIEILLESGEHIIVITYNHYENWCKGRTYKHYGEEDIIYHSGFAFCRKDRE